MKVRSLITNHLVANTFGIVHVNLELFGAICHNSRLHWLCVDGINTILQRVKNVESE